MQNFKKINVEETINNLITNKPELQEHIEKADLEYQFIKSLVLLRKEMGITQNELSKKSGLTQQVISRIETFDSLPTLRTLLKYIDSIGLELEVKKKETMKK